MSLMRWEPFRDMMTLREAMDRLFEESFVRPRRRWEAEEMRYNVPMDVYETDEEVIVTVAVPGVDPDSMDITVEGNTLNIRGEVEGPLENVDYVLQERPYGTFNRSVQLNAPVDANKAEASFDQGILTLQIPKQEEAKPKTIKIKTK
ncbi:MAG: Hsp20/alpha crystallin family protein [Chloroflexota bacterium]|nr:Hsp20/alpha crystallin family protein [Chloroflexota bacterium]